MVLVVLVDVVLVDVVLVVEVVVFGQGHAGSNVVVVVVGFSGSSVVEQGTSRISRTLKPSTLGAEQKQSPQ